MMSKASIHGQLRYIGASIPEADRLSLILHLEYWGGDDRAAYARLAEMRLEAARLAASVRKDRQSKQAAGYPVDMLAPIQWGCSRVTIDGVLIQ